jgi:hypothetical protein
MWSKDSGLERINANGCDHFRPTVEVAIKGIIEIREKLGSMGAYKTVAINTRYIEVVYKDDDGSCAIYLAKCNIRIRPMESYTEVLEKIREAGGAE